MRKSILAAASVLLLCSAGAAAPIETLSAQLSDINGKVLVDRGEGFAVVSEDTKLVPGNRVLVSGEGHAVLTYGPGCSMPLASDSMTTFTGTESCAIGTQGTKSGGTGLLFLGTAGAFAPAGIGIAGAIAGSDNQIGPQS